MIACKADTDTARKWQHLADDVAAQLQGESDKQVALAYVYARETHIANVLTMDEARRKVSPLAPAVGELDAWNADSGHPFNSQLASRLVRLGVERRWMDASSRACKSHTATKAAFAQAISANHAKRPWLPPLRLHAALKGGAE